MAYYVKSIYSLEISHKHTCAERKNEMKKRRRRGSTGNLIKGLAFLSPLPDSIYLSNCRPVILSNHSDLLTEVKFLQILPLFFAAEPANPTFQLIPFERRPLNFGMWWECSHSSSMVQDGQRQRWLRLWNQTLALPLLGLWSRPLILSTILWLIMCSNSSVLTS